MSTLRFDPDTIDRPHLLTISYSHFCESARWAMDYAGEPYTEVAYAIGAHFEPIGALRAHPKRRGTGSYPGMETAQGADRRQHSVPLLCLPGGDVLVDSWEILARYVGAVPSTWRERFDNELGPAARRIAYGQFLDPKRPDLADAMVKGITPEERAMWGETGDFVKATVGKVLGIGDEVIAKDRVLLAAILDEVSESLPDFPAETGKSQAAAWWIAFSSLVGVVLILPRYGGQSWQWPALDSFDAEYQDWAHAMRATAAGQAICEFYERYR